MSFASFFKRDMTMKRIITFGLGGVTTVVLVLGLLALGRAPSVWADGATQRPISDWVAAQGTYCVDDGMGGCFLFVPPLANFLGASDPASGLLASIDYAGIGNAYIVANGGDSLGTEFAGTVTERPLSDGRAEVHVVLHTHNALTWVVDDDIPLTYDFNGPLLFGNRAPDVLAGAEPGLCDAVFKISFINTAPGAPLPDILQMFSAPEAGQEVTYIQMRCNASGPLRALYGVPEGTSGRASIVQNGLFMTGFHGAVGDGFPVERIDLQAVGN
jgi:hypothetical protein